MAINTKTNIIICCMQSTFYPYDQTVHRNLVPEDNINFLKSCLQSERQKVN